MSGNNAVLDTNTIIYASQGRVDAESLLSGYESCFISIISFIEVYAYDFSDVSEKEIIDDILGNLEIIEIDKGIAEQTIVYRRNKAKKIKLPDAVILASAKAFNADLLTDNHRDFQNIDPAIKIVSLQQFRIPPG
ncbi:MAG: putative nucleic acid-binding protein, contains PIN domain [Acidobacteria bacterium OLB17]|nr:MAG: putative nucleic acid-binding protein, contains PIN domain [Acidobacteria bacterium OLB17]MCZ2390556.1 type II toxin-antitoxin system VapC family toxin [Acidobacteriota bacterium]